jgi:hypothetical protein
MASKPQYTAEELAEIQRLEAEIAAEEAALAENKIPGEADEARKRLLAAATRAGVQIISEAGGAAVGQKAGLPLAPYTFGMSVPIGGAIGGLAGYESAMRATGQDPTMLGRLQAAAMGAIPFAPEARLAATAAGNVARVTAPEVMGSAARMAGATGAATVAPKLAMGEELQATDVIPAATGGLTAGLARFAGATTASSTIPGREGGGMVRAAGPSKEAAAAAIEQAQNISRDAQLRNWQAVGGVLDPRRFNPGMVTRAMEKTIGEPQVVLEELRRINMAKVGEVARQEMGLPVTAELTVDVLTARRNQLGQAYEAVRNIGPAAERALDRLQDARDIMRRSWRAWRSAKDANKGTTPDLLDAAEQATQTVEMLENRLETVVRRSGNQALYDSIVAARPQLSKIWIVDSALDRGPNMVDPSVLGQIHNSSPRLLTDGLRMIAEVYNTQKDAFGTQMVREMARERRLAVPAILRVPAAVSLGAQFAGTPGAIAGGVAGALAGQTATDIASDVMRRQMLPFMTGTGGPLAQRFQSVYGQPQYGTNVPSALSLFLAKTGSPSGLQLQQFLQSQQAAPTP